MFVDDVGGATTSVQGAGGGTGSGGVLAGRNGGSARVSGGPGGGVGELAALVANTNPGYHDYMSQVTPRRRGSEAFG